LGQMHGDWLSVYLVFFTAALLYIPYLGAVLMPSRYWLIAYALAGFALLLLLWSDRWLHADDDMNPLTDVMGMLVGAALSAGLVAGVPTRLVTLHFEAKTSSRSPTLTASLCGLAIAIGLSWAHWASF
jgi:hypothetical protein